MEEIKGISLEEYLAERNDKHSPLTEGQIKSITLQVVRAIKYFHEKDIIHRDLKPGWTIYHMGIDNILVEELDGALDDSLNTTTTNEKRLRVKIIDFGLSIQLETSKY